MHLQAILRRQHEELIETIFGDFDLDISGVRRYQPDGALEQRAGTERDYLTSEGGESDLTESESHLNMLKGGSSTLQTVLHPPGSPSEHSCSVVNKSICVLGGQDSKNLVFVMM